jgi:outer membrane receptor protein involved in Fe transport
MNFGLRYDFYNPDDKIYLDIFDPFGVIEASANNTQPVPKTKNTSITGQLSPRIGISHPISDKTVLHFSYGHFFQRADFGNYGEGSGTSDPNQEVTGILNTYLVDPDKSGGFITPYNLGNRQLKPRKTVAYELGIEHNISGIVADVTAFYKDITNTIRTVKIFMSNNVSYLTTGNSDYADAKGVEISIRKPLSGLWGGYLNYSWSTGIAGRSGDPDVIAAPGSGVQTRVLNAVGDEIQYDPPRLKFGLTLLTPNDLGLFKGIFANIQISLDYQVYYPHRQINSDNFLEGGRAYIRPADKNADLRIRKEVDILGVKPALFVEIRNVFNDKWVNLETVSSASPADRARFVNSGFQDFPETDANGGPFPDVLQYRNLPRRITFGFALGL